MESMLINNQPSMKNMKINHSNSAKNKNKIKQTPNTYVKITTDEKKNYVKKDEKSKRKKIEKTKTKIT